MSFLKELESLANPAPGGVEYGEDDDALDAVVSRGGGGDGGQGRSSLRARLALQLPELDPKYKGRVAAKADLFDQPEEPELPLSDEGEEDEEDEDDEDEDEDEEEGEEEAEEAPGPSTAAVLGAHTNEDELQSQRAKGAAIKSQLTLWDALLAGRIKAQRLLSAGNRLPQTADAWPAEADPGLRSRVGKELDGLLGSLLRLQHSLYAADPALAAIVGAEAPEGAEAESDDEEILSSPDPSDDEKEEEEGEEDEDGDAAAAAPAKRRRVDAPPIEATLSGRHSAYFPYRDATLSKWFEKTRLASGRRRGLAAMELDVVRQIEQIMSNETRLIQRTQSRRSHYAVIGKAEEMPEEDADEPLDAEIFDDDDFYQELLRELIERKAGKTSDPVALTRQYLELQKLRGKTAKRRIDTKASKGRKVRYTVMRKLVSLMGPVEAEAMSGLWTTEARDQLFASLFGQMPKPVAEKKTE